MIGVEGQAGGQQHHDLGWGDARHPAQQEPAPPCSLLQAMGADLHRPAPPWFAGAAIGMAIMGMASSAMAIGATMGLALGVPPRAPRK